MRLTLLRTLNARASASNLRWPVVLATPRLALAPRRPSSSISSGPSSAAARPSSAPDDAPLALPPSPVDGDPDAIHPALRWRKFSRLHPPSTVPLSRAALEVRARKMFAIVHISGKQFKVSALDRIVVPRMRVEAGKKIILSKVLMVGSPFFTVLGTPLLNHTTASVHATVLEHNLDREIYVYKTKPRKHQRSLKVHRTPFTVLHVNHIQFAEAGQLTRDALIKGGVELEKFL